VLPALTPHPSPSPSGQLGRGKLPFPPKATWRVRGVAFPPVTLQVAYPFGFLEGGKGKVASHPSKLPHILG